MDRTPSYYIFLGLLVGGVLGLGIGIINRNPQNGLQLGALAGVFVGWIITALALQK